MPQGHQSGVSARRRVDAALARIEALEPAIGAFQALDPDVSRAQAEESDRSGGPLAGLLLGVKDIVDTVQFPTAYGSSIYSGRRPAADAACVAQLRSAGAVVMGKTVTTEFALFSPGKTRNPHDSTRTPGGSSSGSAAAVAAGFVDAALGSQTAASITRPSSFCGVVGFKPSIGAYSLAGVKGLAPSLDTLGALARDVTTIAAMHAVLVAPSPMQPVSTPRPALRVGLCRTPWWGKAEQATRDAVEAAAQALALEAEVLPLDLDAFSDGVDLHARIMAFEAAQSLAFEYRAAPEQLSPVLIGILQNGASQSIGEHRRDLRTAREARSRAAALFDRCDVLLAPAAMGEAPLGLGATGDPLFSRMWTLLGLPTVTLPGFRGPNRMPVGIQLLAPIGEDERLLEHALWAERLLPTPPKPRLPEIASS